MTTLPSNIFNFETTEVRVQMRDGQAWFVAADVCAALEIKDTSMAVARLDEDERGTSSIGTPSGEQQMLTVNESGLYSLILGSRKAAAKRFKKWVTSEVLPSIRKTGAYALPTQPALPAATQDKVAAIMMVGDWLAKTVPGLKPGIARAATLSCIHENTGIVMESLRLTLPANDEPICSMNPTAVGRQLGVTARDANLKLAQAGLQVRNARDERELTEAGTKWAEALPYNRQGHSGYQILWNPAVAGLLSQEAAA